MLTLKYRTKNHPKVVSLSPEELRDAEENSSAVILLVCGGVCYLSSPVGSWYLSWLTGVLSWFPSYGMLTAPAAFPGGLNVKLDEPEYQYFSSYCLSWRRQWHPTPVLLPGKSHGWRSLVGYSPWGHRVGHD